MLREQKWSGQGERGHLQIIEGDEPTTESEREKGVYTYTHMCIAHTHTHTLHWHICVYHVV